MKNSFLAGQDVLPTTTPNASSFASRLFVCILFIICIVCALTQPTLTRAQNSSGIPATTAATPEIDQNSAALASPEQPAKFQVNVKLVPGRGGVRDSQGH